MPCAPLPMEPAVILSVKLMLLCAYEEIVFKL